jgi:hypothetical protein
MYKGGVVVTMWCCPTCGYPHGESDVPRVRRARGFDDYPDDDQLLCQVCDSVSFRWEWTAENMDGAFDWPVLEELMG